MIAQVDDFCLCVYVLVDDMYKELEGHLRRPGPKPKCSDSELIAISLIGECMGWDVETELLNHMQAHRDKFPIIPARGRPPAPSPDTGRGNGGRFSEHLLYQAGNPGIVICQPLRMTPG